MTSKLSPFLTYAPTTTKKTTEETVQKEKKTKKQRVLSIFPTNIASLSKEDCAKLSFKPNGMAETIIQALQKHGIEAGDKRKEVVEQVKGKFTDASKATIRTQIYRGIVYLRLLT